MAEDETLSDQEEFLSPQRMEETAECTPPRLHRKPRMKRLPVHNATCPWNPSRRLVFSSQEDKSPVKPKPSKKRKRRVKRRHGGRSKKRKFEKRDLDVSGTWVQCSNRDCMKWRYLSDITDPSQIPDVWTCEMSSDTSHNSCQLPEQDYSSLEFVHSKFTEGSIVWGKMQGFPWWPAMIEEDPDNELCLYPDPITGQATDYHVIFLDKNVTRCWIKTSNILKYDLGGEAPGTMKIKGHDYTQKIQTARGNADRALSMSIEERIKTFGLSATFRGSWGDYISSTSDDSQSQLEPKTKKVKKNQKERRAVNKEEPVDDSLLSHSDMEDILDEAEALLEEVQDIVMDVEEEVKEDLLQLQEMDELLSQSGDDGTSQKKKGRPKKTSNVKGSTKLSKEEKEKLKREKKEQKMLRKLAEKGKLKQEKEELIRLRKLEKELNKEKKRQEVKEMKEIEKLERKEKKTQEKMAVKEKKKEESEKERMEKKEKKKQEKKERKERKKQAKREKLALAGGDEKREAQDREKSNVSEAEKQAQKEKKCQEKAEKKKLKKEEKQKKKLETQSKGTGNKQNQIITATKETGKVKPCFQKPKKSTFTAPTQKASVPPTESTPVLSPQCESEASSVRKDIEALLSEIAEDDNQKAEGGLEVGVTTAELSAPALDACQTPSSSTETEKPVKKPVKSKFTIKTKDGQNFVESGLQGVQNPATCATTTSTQNATAETQEWDLGNLEDEASVDIGKILEINREQESQASIQDGKTAKDNAQGSQSSDPLAFPLSQMTGKQLEPVAKPTVKETKDTTKDAPSMPKDEAAPKYKSDHFLDDTIRGSSVRESGQPERKTPKLDDIEEFSPDMANWSEPDSAQLVPGQKTVMTAIAAGNGNDSEDSEPFDMEE